MPTVELLPDRWVTLQGYTPVSTPTVVYSGPADSTFSAWDSISFTDPTYTVGYVGSGMASDDGGTSTTAMQRFDITGGGVVTAGSLNVRFDPAQPLPPNTIINTITLNVVGGMTGGYSGRFHAALLATFWGANYYAFQPGDLILDAGAYTPFTVPLPYQSGITNDLDKLAATTGLSGTIAAGDDTTGGLWLHLPGPVAANPPFGVDDGPGNGPVILTKVSLIIDYRFVSQPPLRQRQVATGVHTGDPQLRHRQNHAVEPSLRQRQRGTY